MAGEALPHRFSVDFRKDRRDRRNAAKSRLKSRPLIKGATASDSEGIALPPWLPRGLESSKVTDVARLAMGIDSLQRGINSGDEKHGMMVIGQIIGIIDKESTVKEIIDSIGLEAKAVSEEIGEKVFG